jgi:formylglycine-generating enzyme required for sulfatase activity
MGVTRVIRGGSWLDYAAGYCRVSYRLNDTPDYRLNYLGFRLSLQ